MTKLRDVGSGSSWERSPANIYLQGAEEDRVRAERRETKSATEALFRAFERIDDKRGKHGNGGPKKKPQAEKKSRHVSACLTEEQEEQLRSLALLHGKPLSSVLSGMVSDALNRLSAEERSLLTAIAALRKARGAK